jgi:hypothetical protein
MYYKFKKTLDLNDDAIDVQTILEKAESVFKEFQFDKVEIKNNSVQFKNNTFYFSSPLEYKKYISKGKLTVLREERQIKVTYESNTPIWGFIVVLIFGCIVGFILETFLFVIVLFIGLITGYSIISDGGINILNRLKQKIEYDKSKY